MIKNKKTLNLKIEIDRQEWLFGAFTLFDRRPELIRLALEIGEATLHPSFTVFRWGLCEIKYDEPLSLHRARLKYIDLPVNRDFRLLLDGTTSPSNHTPSVASDDSHTYMEDDDELPGL